MKILYQDFFNFLKGYFLNWLSYHLNYPFVKPWRVNFDVTHACPLRCKMCRIWRMPRKGKEMSIEDAKKLVDQIAAWGIDHISFAGGETLVRKDFTVELIEYASSKNIRTDLITSGVLLDEELCERLMDAGLSKISLSVDGATKETHDYIRGEGTFEKIMRVAEILKTLKEEKKSNIELEFTTVIMGLNFEELVDIFELMVSKGFDYITYQVVVPDNTFTQPLEFFKKFYESEFWIKPENIPKLRRICEQLIEIKKKTGKIRNTRGYLRKIPEYFEKKEKFKPGKCIAGYSYLNIDPYGNINICGIGPNLNVIGKDLRKIWKSKEYKRTRILIKKCKRPCLMLCYEKLEFFPLLEAWLELRGWVK